MISIDINCDMAEGAGNEESLMPWISSANIACGYHAGSDALMKETIDLCRQNNVAIGAHPSFPDRDNFGRTNMIFPHNQIIDIVQDQLYLLKAIGDRQGAVLHHVKPHGALYNMAAKDPLLAHSIATAIHEVDPALILYGLSQSVMIGEAEKLNLMVAHEAFADRTYQPDGSLTPRSQPNALIESEGESVDQVLNLITRNKVKTISGTEIDLKADTICLHGDGAHAIAFARRIYSAIVADGIAVKAI